MRQQWADREPCLRLLRLRDDAHQFACEAVDDRPSSVSAFEWLPECHSALKRKLVIRETVSTWHSNSLVKSEVFSSFRLSIRLMRT